MYGLDARRKGLCCCCSISVFLLFFYMRGMCAGCTRDVYDHTPGLWLLIAIYPFRDESSIMAYFFVYLMNLFLYAMLIVQLYRRCNLSSHRKYQCRASLGSSLSTRTVFSYRVVIPCSSILELWLTFSVCYAARQHRHSRRRLRSCLQGEHLHCLHPYTTPKDWTCCKSRDSLASNNRPSDNDIRVANALVYAVEVPTTSDKHRTIPLGALGVGLSGALAKHGVQSTYTTSPDLYALR